MRYGSPPTRPLTLERAQRAKAAWSLRLIIQKACLQSHLAAWALLFAIFA
jgi:hypothetical protein